MAAWDAPKPGVVQLLLMSLSVLKMMLLDIICLNRKRKQQNMKLRFLFCLSSYHKTLKERQRRFKYWGQFCGRLQFNNFNFHIFKVQIGFYLSLLNIDVQSSKQFCDIFQQACDEISNSIRALTSKALKAPLVIWFLIVFN